LWEERAKRDIKQWTGKVEDADDEEMSSSRKSCKATRGARPREIKTEKYDGSACVETFFV